MAGVGAMREKRKGNNAPFQFSRGKKWDNDKNLTVPLFCKQKRRGGISA